MNEKNKYYATGPKRLIVAHPSDAPLVNQLQKECKEWYQQKEKLKSMVENILEEQLENRVIQPLWVGDAERLLKEIEPPITIN